MDLEDGDISNTQVVAGGPTGIGLLMDGVGFMPVLHMIADGNAERVIDPNEARYLVCVDAEGNPFEADLGTQTIYDITYH